MTEPQEGWRDDPGWFVSNKYGDRGFCIANPEHVVSVYIEPYEKENERLGTTYTAYSVGLHDRTIAAHPTIPSSLYEERSWWRALCRVFELIENVDVHLGEMRMSDAYQRAIEVKERAPPTREEGGVIPGFEVRNREGAVYSGRMSVEEAVEELEGPVMEKHT